MYRFLMTTLLVCASAQAFAAQREVTDPAEIKSYQAKVRVLLKQNPALSCAGSYKEDLIVDGKVESRYEQSIFEKQKLAGVKAPTADQRVELMIEVGADFTTLNFHTLTSTFPKRGSEVSRDVSAYGADQIESFVVVSGLSKLSVVKGRHMSTTSIRATEKAPASKSNSFVEFQCR